MSVVWRADGPSLARPAGEIPGVSPALLRGVPGDHVAARALAWKGRQRFDYRGLRLAFDAKPKAEMVPAVLARGKASLTGPTPSTGVFERCRQPFPLQALLPQAL